VATPVEIDTILADPPNLGCDPPLHDPKSFAV